MVVCGKVDAYCSKYNPIEHRLFSQITRSWSGAPLLSLEDAARPAAETTTSKGLTVYVDLNNKTYDIQRSIDESYDDTLKKRVVFQTVLSKWNYLVKRSEFLPSYSFRITKFFITFANVRLKLSSKKIYGTKITDYRLSWN